MHGNMAAATVSHKLSNSFEGALAGGGDPATSPLYVFGPFLKLIVAAGVAEVTFGASIWLVVLTIAAVSAMYRLVMSWVTDGSGGSGLTEEEFGGWAVKINAGITFVEYTLTFLVSMAALVTFIADRFPVLNQGIDIIQYRTIVAILLSVMTGWLVNRGPKTAAAIFGPATAAVLALLWAMNIATVIKLGIHLPPLHLEAFSGEYLHYTLSGYARILAVMTGIEVFANLVAAYDGTPEEKSRKAFGSLLIIMGTAAVTMLITGPAIYRLSDPTNPDVSVFTQTMDKLLPPALSYTGTLVGIAVLLSASAASAQGLQNLALGLKHRHYIPRSLGRRNRFGVAPMPVWIEVGIVSLAFLIFGTREETYLSLYAAGVFILLSMTGWAVVKRLARMLREKMDTGHLLTLSGSGVAAALTTGATLIIFGERLKEGAWTYFLFIPALYVVFDRYRRTLGNPTPLEERLGSIEESMWSTKAIPPGRPETVDVQPAEVEFTFFEMTPERLKLWAKKRTPPKHIIVPLDGSSLAEQALPVAEALQRVYKAKLTLVSVVRWRTMLGPVVKAVGPAESARVEHEKYLKGLEKEMRAGGVRVDHVVGLGPVAETLNYIAEKVNADLIVMTARGRSGLERWSVGSKASKILQITDIPVLLIRPSKEEGIRVRFKTLLVPLDGSEFSERVLPYVRSVDPAFVSKVILLTVPIVPEPELYGTMADVVESLRMTAEAQAYDYLNSVADVLRKDGLDVEVMVRGTDPATTIVDVSEEKDVDLVMITSHGRGGYDPTSLGKVADRVIHGGTRPTFLLPIQEKRHHG